VTQLALYIPASRLGATFSAALDGARLTNNTARVFALLMDEQSHTLDELRAVGGAQADRRARDLRSERLGGFQVLVTRDPDAPDSGRWLYRIVMPTAEQVRVARKALGIDHG
jgi:hypothetical protein